MTTLTYMASERAESSAGREIRCARWLWTALDRNGGRGRFVMQVSRKDERRCGLFDTATVEFLRVPSSVFRSWQRRNWIALVNQHGRATLWAVTPEGRDAARPHGPHMEAS
jgi:hypothetical protein